MSHDGVYGICQPNKCLEEVMTKEELLTMLPEDGSPITTAGGKLNLHSALSNTMFNHLWFFNPADMVIETSTNGTSWTTASVTDAEKRKLVAGNYSGSLSVSAYVRFTFTKEAYVCLKMLYLYTDSGVHNLDIKIEEYLNSTSAWSTVLDWVEGVGHWPGHVYLPHANIKLAAQSNKSGKARVTIRNNSSSEIPIIRDIRWYSGHDRVERGNHLYSWDENQNVTFPGKVSANGGIAGGAISGTTGTFSGAVTGATFNGVVLKSSGTITVTPGNTLMGFVPRHDTTMTVCGVLTLLPPNGTALYSGSVKFKNTSTSQANVGYFIGSDDEADDFYIDASSDYTFTFSNVPFLVCFAKRDVKYYNFTLS